MGLVLTMRDRLVACCPCFETLASLAPQHEVVVFQQSWTSSPRNGFAVIAGGGHEVAVSKDGLQYRFVIPGTRTMRSSPKPISAKPRRRPAGHPPPKPYHHGDLRRVLIDAALGLAEEGGAEAVSVREAARRAGVSPGAPFRHFPSRVALMTAVAEEAQRRFRAEIEVALSEVPAGDPLARFRAF